MSTERDEARRLVDEARVRAGRRQTAMLAVALIAVLTVAVIAVLALFLAVQAANRNREVLRQVLAVAETARAGTEAIKDCTVAGGACYQRGVSQTASAISTLNAATVLADADLLRKLGEMAVALGAPKAVVARILAEPTPRLSSLTSPASPARSSPGSTRGCSSRHRYNAAGPSVVPAGVHCVPR